MGLKLLSSLQNRVFLASSLVAILTIAFAAHFVTGRIAGEAEAELRRGLNEAGSLVEKHHAARLETLTVHARLIADLPKLKAAVETGDSTTVQPIAVDYRSRVGSDLFVVTNRRGDVLGALGRSGTARVDGAAIRGGLAGREVTTFQAEGARILHVVTVPILFDDPPEVMGTLSLGFSLDDALAAQFKAVTASEVGFAVEGNIRASTFPAASRPALAPVLQADGVMSITIDGNEYVALRRPLTPSVEAGAPVALILRSRTERLSFLRTLRTALLVAALVAILVAVIMSYAVARTVTRPLAAITTAMREMRDTGDLALKIPPGRSWDDEDANLLATTFNSLTEAILRFQRAAAQRDRLSALGRLSTVMAHEIRNPLMILKACARTFRRAELPGEELREAAADIDHEVARLDRIVQDVLDFARPVNVEPGTVDLNALCRDAVAAAFAGTADAACGLRLDPEVPPVVTDGERLRAVLVNILANARDAVAAKAAEDGGGVAAPAVELATSRIGGDRVAIVVSDRGSGISPADLPHVFEPYFTTKRTGTGLGLAIAKNVVDCLGGVIAARSRTTEGTEIQVELPLAGPRAASSGAGA